MVHCPANFGPGGRSVPWCSPCTTSSPSGTPSTFPGRTRAIVRAMIRLAARSARAHHHGQPARRATTSLASSACHRERVDVVPLAACDPRPADVEPGADATTSCSPSGNRMPHKGFDTLLEALARIDRDASAAAGHHGQPRRRSARAARRALGLGEHVRAPRMAERRRARSLYLESTALVFPTRFEGFGLPAARGDGPWLSGDHAPTCRCCARWRDDAARLRRPGRPRRDRARDPIAARSTGACSADVGGGRRRARRRAPGSGPPRRPSARVLPARCSTPGRATPRRGFTPSVRPMRHDRARSRAALDPLAREPVESGAAERLAARRPPRRSTRRAHRVTLAEPRTR